MAVAVDQASLGSAAGNVTTTTLTTTGAVASGAHVIVLLGTWNSPPRTHSVSGSLTWTQAHVVTSGDLRVSLWYAPAPAGLASSTALTVGTPSGVSGVLACANSYTGIDTAGTVVAFNGAGAATAAWATGSVAGGAGDALIGGAWGDGTLRTSTVTGPAVERIDVNSGVTSQSVTLVDKLTVAGSDSLAGTWSGALDHIAIGVAFKAAAGAAAKSAAIQRQPARGLVMHAR
jgi:hypothetical protein